MRREVLRLGAIVFATLVTVRAYAADRALRSRECRVGFQLLAEWSVSSQPKRIAASRDMSQRVIRCVLQARGPKDIQVIVVDQPFPHRRPFAFMATRAAGGESPCVKASTLPSN